MNNGLSLVLQAVGRHLWPALATLGAVLCSSALYIQVTPPLYESSTRIMLNSRQLSVSDLGRDLADLPSAPGASPIATQVELTRSQRVLKRALEAAALQGIKNLPTVDGLRGDLKVSIVPATGILELTYRNPRPAVAAGILNAIADAMVVGSSDDIRSEARAMRQFLEVEVPLKKAALQKAELAATQYKRASGLVSLNAQTKSWVEGLAALEGQIQVLSAELEESKAQTASLKQLTRAGTLKDAYTKVSISQNESLKALRAKLEDVEAQVAISRSRLGDQHPDLLAQVAQRDEIRRRYLQQVSRLLPKGVAPEQVETSASGALSQELVSKLILSDVERQALESKLALLKSSQTQLQERLQQLPNREQVLLELTRQREVAVNSLSLLQNKLEEARIAEAQLLGNITVIDRAAAAERPKWPSKVIILVIATAAGVVLATGVILLLEMLDGTLHSVTDAESLLKMPILGVLPVLMPASVSMQNPESFLADLGSVESYRTLLKTLEFRSFSKLKVIVVSSALSQEGKSVVASHLAAISAMLSRTTLLIDADLRMPTQHALFGLAQQPGLSECLLGDVSLGQVIQNTSTKGLYAITAGKMHAQPSQLLELPSLSLLLDEVSRRFDLVIIDTAPLTICADAATLSRHSDGLLIVARPNFTAKEQLARAIAELSNNRCSILGVAINGLNSPADLYYRSARKTLAN